METLTVALDARSYPIHIGHGLDVAALLAPHAAARALIVSDGHVAPLYAAPLRAALQDAGIASELLTVPPGEASKSFAQLQFLLEAMLALRPDRRTAVIALGGGVVGDLAGFAASVLLRGVPFIQLPTTLLSQVDSSVGGKTGINAGAGKNLVGSFYQPRAVLIDTAWLATLPPRDLRAGYAEIVKYGMIGTPPSLRGGEADAAISDNADGRRLPRRLAPRNDDTFFAWLETHGRDVLALEPSALLHAIHESCAAKAAIVAEDERESGKRALLNFGHTLGHALEAAMGYDGRLHHGEGVAIGMVFAARLSHRLGLCGEDAATRLAAHLAACGLPTGTSQLGPLDAGALLDAMRQDKKAEGGRLRFILLRGIGRAEMIDDVPSDTVRAELESFLSPDPSPFNG